MINFTPIEKKLIKRLSVRGGWEKDDAALLKKKIKDHFMVFANRCCYCLRSLHEQHRITIDVEHILPKHKFSQFTFEPLNLNLACKRCNMGVKGKDYSFYRGAENDPAPFDSAHYSIVHPNSDNLSDHLRFISVQCNDSLLIMYTIIDDSPKGKATYQYFRLADIAVDTFDVAQGIDSTEEMMATLPTHVATKVKRNIDGL